MPGLYKHRFETDLDLQGFEIINARLEQITTAWGTPADGMIGYVSTTGDKRIAFYDSALAALVKVPRLDRTETVTGLWTFSRSTDPPFAVNSGAAKVTYLDADMVDGWHASQSATASTIATRTSGGQVKAADPSVSDDCATKGWVEDYVSQRQPKASVVAATTANITLSGAQTIDGVSVVAGNRVLVKDQTNTYENGIYVCASGSWSRATDADAWDELVQAYVWVDGGTTNIATGWLCLAEAGGTLGVDAVLWTKVDAAGTVFAGNGLVKDSNTLHFCKSSSYTVGDLFYASSTSAVAALAAVATGNALISQGTSAAPAWGKIGLTTHVSGTLPIANGGTNSSTALNNNRLMVSTSGAIVERDALTANALVVGSSTAGEGGVKTFALGAASKVLAMNSGATAMEWTSISDGHVDSGAGIQRSKLATGTASHVVINNGSGVMSSEAQLALTRGGTGASLADPDADRILFWDDSVGAVSWLAGGNTVVITGTTIDTAQDLRSTASPTFNGLTLTSLTITGLAGILKATAGVVAGSAALDDLSDVTITAATTGHLIRYSGSAWVNTTLAEGDIPSLSSTKISDFAEAARDAVGAMATDSSTIDFTYDDPNNTLTAAVKATSISNTHIASGAAIAWSKISKTGSMFNEIGDVTINSATSGQFLKYNGIEWINASFGSGSGVDADTVDGTHIASGITQNTVIKMGASSTLSASNITDNGSVVQITMPDSSGALRVALDTDPTNYQCHVTPVSPVGGLVNWQWLTKNGATTYQVATMSGEGNFGVGSNATEPLMQFFVCPNSTEGSPSVTSGTIVRFQTCASSASVAYVGIVGGSAGAAGLFFGDKDSDVAGKLVYSNSADEFQITTGASLRWTITSAGVLQSNGAQTIKSSSSTLTLSTGSNGDILVMPDGTGKVGIGGSVNRATVNIAAGRERWTIANWYQSLRIGVGTLYWAKGTNYAWGMGQSGDDFYLIYSAAEDNTQAPNYPAIFRPTDIRFYKDMHLLNLTASRVLQIDSSKRVVSSNDLPSGVTMGSKKIALCYAADLSFSGGVATLTHNLGSKDVVVMLRDTTADGEADHLKSAQIVASSTSAVTISVNRNVTARTYRATVVAYV